MMFILSSHVGAACGPISPVHLAAVRRTPRTPTLSAVSLTRRPPLSSGLQRPVRGRTLQHSSVESLQASRLYPQIKGPYFPSRLPEHVRHEHGARSLCGRAQSVEEKRHARRVRRACPAPVEQLLLINHGPAAEGTVGRRAKGTRFTGMCRLSALRRDRLPRLRTDWKTDRRQEDRPGNQPGNRPEDGPEDGQEDQRTDRRTGGPS